MFTRNAPLIVEGEFCTGGYVPEPDSQFLSASTTSENAGDCCRRLG